MTDLQIVFPAELQGHIGLRLREIYSDLVNQAVPERFLSLLEELSDRGRMRGCHEYGVSAEFDRDHS